MIEGLFSADFEYLRRLYEEVNSAEEPDGLPSPDAQPAEGLGVAGAGTGGSGVPGEA